MSLYKQSAAIVATGTLEEIAYLREVFSDWVLSKQGIT